MPERISYRFGVEYPNAVLLIDWVDFLEIRGLSDPIFEVKAMTERKTTYLGWDIQQLPEQIQKEITRERQNSEIIISIFQIFILAFFSVFYSLTPKGFDEGVMFQPVPLALTVYGAFIFTKTFVALRRKINWFWIVLSIVVDMTVLMVTIWSFHLQYNAPPELYLKAPTLMYVFIFIALHSMRLDTGYILLSGLTAIVGWTVLVVYAVLASSQMTITKSFYEYVTSHSILIGAEVDKIVSIAGVTLIMAFAVSRARKLLIRSVVEGKAAEDLSRFFSPEVASRIKATAGDFKPGMAEERDASIIFVDLRGFSKLAGRHSGKDIMELLSSYQALIIDITSRHGGSIDKFIGDGVLVSFGATKADDIHAKRAMCALEEIVAKGVRWQKKREAEGQLDASVNAALNSGKILFGTVGGEDQLEYTVIGDAVNLAAKLEKHCKTEGVLGLTTQATFELAKSQGYIPRIEWNGKDDAHVDGINGTVDLMLGPAAKY